MLEHYTNKTYFKDNMSIYLVEPILIKEFIQLPDYQDVMVISELSLCIQKTLYENKSINEI